MQIRTTCSSGAGTQAAAISVFGAPWEALLGMTSSSYTHISEHLRLMSSVGVPLWYYSPQTAKTLCNDRQSQTHNADLAGAYSCSVCLQEISS